MEGEVGNDHEFLRPPHTVSNYLQDNYKADYKKLVKPLIQK